MAEHTPTPWDWLIHDHSMASLGVMPDPGLGNPLVLAIGPCPACADRAQPREWKWGRCHTPSEADAEFILTAVNNHDAMVAELQRLFELYGHQATADVLGRCQITIQEQPHD
jgi:hypothetical protein